MKKTICFFTLIIILALPLVFPLFRSGYFPTHDGEWAVVRLGAMYRALMAGHFPVRWAGNLNFSYGYPLFLFTYPLPYYLGEVFSLVGFGLVGAIKILFVLSVVFSGWAMFLLGRELFGVIGGLISSVFYLYAPFRLVNLYVRGSLGESLAFVLFPLLFWVFLKLSRSDRFWVSIGAVFFASLLLTHNVSALLFAPFLAAFATLLILRAPKNKKKRIFWVQRALTVFILGVGLAAFFLIPALVEKKNIVLSQIPLADKTKHFVNLRQLIVASWGYGSPGSEDAFSFQLGWAHLVGLLIGLAFSVKDTCEVARRDSSEVEGFFFSLASLAVLIFLMSSASFLFWQKMPLFSEIDFPWRALGLTSFFMALGLGWLGKKSRFLALGLAVLAVLVNVGYAKPSGWIDYGDDYYLTNEATTTSNDELMPIWVKEKPIERPEERVEIISGGGEISNVIFNSKKMSFNIKAATKSEVQMNTIYFPGWKVKVDNHPTTLLYRNVVGLMRFTVKPGEHRVAAEFGETPLRLFADAISLMSFALIGGLLIKKKIRKKLY